MQYSVSVEVSLRPGVADPEGTTIERSLPALGFDGVSDVRVGKSIRFAIDAATPDDAHDRVVEMCERFLTNPVIEDANVTVEVP